MLMSFWSDIKTVFSNFSPLGCFIWTIILPTWLSSSKMDKFRSINLTDILFMAVAFVCGRHRRCCHCQNSLPRAKFTIMFVWKQTSATTFFVSGPPLWTAATTTIPIPEAEQNTLSCPIATQKAFPLGAWTRYLKQILFCSSWFLPIGQWANAVKTWCFGIGRNLWREKKTTLFSRALLSSKDFAVPPQLPLPLWLRLAVVSPLGRQEMKMSLKAKAVVCQCPSQPKALFWLEIIINIQWLVKLLLPPISKRCVFPRWKNL